MKKNKVLTMLLIATMAVSISGCSLDLEEGDAESSTVTLSDEDFAKKFEEGKYYILHDDNSIEELAFPHGTIKEDEIISTPDSQRAAMYGDDFKDIPTLKKGDMLVMYSSGEVPSFTFERFEDMGYSIPIVGLKVTPSHRLEVSTDIENGCTYPDSAADAILEAKAETVVIDEIGGKKLRVASSDIDGTIYDADGRIIPKSNEDSAVISRCGSINGLKKNDKSGNLAKYKTKIYEGSEEREIVLTADTRILASYQITETNDYEYVMSHLISITIPDYFNSGYYLINGKGMFRYLDEGTKKDADIDDRMIFNDYNDTTSAPVDHVNTDLMVEESPGVNADSAECETRTLTITKEQLGQWAITVSAEGSARFMGDGVPDIEAFFMTPDGKQYKMRSGKDGALYANFTADKEGIYTFKVYNLEGRRLKIQAEPQKGEKS